jgi:hypothetical protein
VHAHGWLIVLLINASTVSDFATDLGALTSRDQTYVSTLTPEKQNDREGISQVKSISRIFPRLLFATYLAGNNDLMRSRLSGLRGSELKDWVGSRDLVFAGSATTTISLRFCGLQRSDYLQSFLILVIHCSDVLNAFIEGTLDFISCAGRRIRWRRTLLKLARELRRLLDESGIDIRVINLEIDRNVGTVDPCLKRI